MPKAPTTERINRRGVAVAMETFEALGFAFREQQECDYGIDAHAELIESNAPTGRLLGIQLKTGESYAAELKDDFIVFRVDAEHVDYWLGHSLPAIVCISDLESRKILWQAITADTAISTGKHYKFHLPTSQVVDAKAVPTFRDLLTPVVSADRYTIFKTDDTSHGTAKRYSFDIVINGTASKSEIASIVRQVTTDGAQRRYHRNHLVEGRWGDSDAHVVWTFVYPSAEDLARRNHFCRSIWINESLDESARPMGFDGENVGGNVVIDWSTNYEFLAKHTSENTLNKEDYLNQVMGPLDELKQLLPQLESGLKRLKEKAISEDTFLTTTAGARKRTNELCTQLLDVALAPFECKAFDEKLECFVVSMDNIVLHYSDQGLKTWSEDNRLYLALKQCSYATEHLSEMAYELKKVT